MSLWSQPFPRESSCTGGNRIFLSSRLKLPVLWDGIKEKIESADSDDMLSLEQTYSLPVASSSLSLISRALLACQTCPGNYAQTLVKLHCLRVLRRLRDCKTVTRVLRTAYASRSRRVWSLHKIGMRRKLPIRVQIRTPIKVPVFDALWKRPWNSCEVVLKKSSKLWSWFLDCLLRNTEQSNSRRLFQNPVPEAHLTWRGALLLMQ